MPRPLPRSSNLFRTFGIRLRRWIRPALLPLVIVLLSINLFYTLVRIGNTAPPNTRHITRTLHDITAATQPTVEAWLTTPDDSLFLHRLWLDERTAPWSKQGVSLLLFRDSSMVYWSRYIYQANVNRFWLTPSSTLRQIGTHQILTHTEARNGRCAVVAIDLHNELSGWYNSTLFPDTRIRLLPDSDSTRARHPQALPVQTDGYSFYIEALPIQNMPWWAELCGWGAILLFGLYIKNHVRLRTTRHNVLRNAGLLMLLFVLLRIGLYYSGLPNPHGTLFSKIYGIHNYTLGSLGDLLLSYSLFFIYAAYLFQVRAKLNWQYRRLNRTGKGAAILLFSAVVAVIISIFHYALILSIYTPKINIQISDIFALSFASAMFYLLTILFVSIRVLIANTARYLFGTRKLILRTLLTTALILLLLYPIETQIRQTGYILILFYLASAGAEAIRHRFQHYGSFILSLVIFSAYIAYFATRENWSAQNNAQKLYARILATSPHDHALMSSEQQRNGELSLDARFRNFTYAHISSHQISFKHNNGNNYQGMAALVTPGRDTFLTRDGQTHFLYNYYDQNGQPGILVISRKATTVLDAVSLYVYIFILLYILCGLLLEMSGYTFNIQRLGTRMTFKIRAVVIGVVLFAMLAVTLVIVNHTLTNFQHQQRQFINNNIQRLGRSLSQFLGSQPLDAALVRTWLESENRDIGYSINIYSTNGDLIGSSTPEFLFPPRMNSSAYRYLHYLKRPLYVADLNRRRYTSAFAPIYSAGELKGYLNLAYESSSNTNRFQQHELLTDILNLFLIILCVAVILSEILYRLLSKPFNQLHEAMGNISKMQKIDAVGSSRKISDEVGMLVEQYNTMIDYLEASYRQLARSEREGAWREMARQVAHEIKNPLTPMRLKIQMLQRYMHDHSGEELNARVESTLTLLLEQIDLLTKIASEFSDFAKLGEGHPTRIDLIPLVSHVAKLYDDQEHVQVTLHTPQTDDGTPIPSIWVTADSDHLTRVFVNICQNAVQAMSGQREARIDISLTLSQEWVHIHFHDNGPGIPEEIRDKIFVPNFTTKSSGSGLGLALSRKIVESLGGTISFESVIGEGTTFTVSLSSESSSATPSVD